MVANSVLSYVYVASAKPGLAIAKIIPPQPAEFIIEPLGSDPRPGRLERLPPAA